MNARTAQALLYALLFIVSAAISAPIWVWSKEQFLARRGMIVEHVDGYVARPRVERGGTLQVVMRYRKQADCPGTWAYSVRWAGAPGFTNLSQGEAGTNPPGSYEFLHNIRIPADAPIGPADWVEIVSFDCGAWSTVSRSRPLRFEVIDRAGGT